jgi:hypothetical protein
MSLDQRLRILFGILTIGLLTTALLKLKTVPGGMILSGLFLGVMMIFGIVISCLILAVLLRFIFRKASFFTLFLIATSISFLAFHYKLYSPTLNIRVPNGYRGQINLVLSNLRDNILTVDSNGVGYINEWTFDKTYTRPKVEQIDGKSLDENLIGFNHSTFFGKGKSCCIGKLEIHSLSFTIGTRPHLEDEYFPSKNLIEIVDTSKALLINLDKYSTVVETTTIDFDK